MKTLTFIDHKKVIDLLDNTTAKQGQLLARDAVLMCLLSACILQK